MEHNTVRDYLDAIHACYTRVYALTAGALDECDAVDYQQIVHQRGAILEQIGAYKRTLEKQYPRWRTDRARGCISLRGDIRELIQRILNLDEAMRKTLEGAIGDRRKEAAGLNASVRAAGAYARQGILSTSR
jgi:hypothetical protein